MTFPNAKWQSGTGKQVILKSDFVDIENAILAASQTGGGNPTLRYVDDDTVKLFASADCPGRGAFVGIPNAKNLGSWVDGGLSDNKVRTVTGDLSILFDSTGLYGTTQTRMVSQWYAGFALAAGGDTDFYLKAMPWMRVKGQAGQVISCGENITYANPRNYVFTNDDSLILGGKIYFVTGASQGLMRTIIHNNVASSATTIEYSGGGLTVSAGDWFIILPPKKFLWLTDIYNDPSSNIISVSPFLFATRGYELFTTPGNNYWTCPLGVTVAKVSLGGGGGGGGYPQQSGAGGGGGFLVGFFYPAPGRIYTVYVGVGGNASGGGGWGSTGGSTYIYTPAAISVPGGGGGYDAGPGGPAGNYAATDGAYYDGVYSPPKGGVCAAAGAFGNYSRGGNGYANGYGGMALIEW